MKKRLVIFLIGCFAFGFHTWAQEMSFSSAEKYTIAGIDVTGTTSYNEQTVVAYTGLRVGEEIYVPGKKISKILKKLWDLGLFSDINFYAKKIEGDRIWLEIEIKEVPTLVDVRVEGVKKKNKRETIIKENELKAGTKVTENLIATTRNYLEKKYKEDGYLNADVSIRTIPVSDTTNSNHVNMIVHVERNDRVKIKKIKVEGNEVFSDAKVLRQMKNTKKRNFFRFWKRSKFINEKYQEDKKALIQKYKEKGYRDARIVSDTMIKLNDKLITLKLNLEEGEKYYFGDISFLGNSVYNDTQLHKILQINKGDAYNATLLQKRIANPEKPGSNITDLYQNNGYLFSNFNVVETQVYNDTIDFEIRVHEGKIAYFDHIKVVGNDKTNDHVIYRNLRTFPGQKYNKSDVMRSIRELGQLGFFDPAHLMPEFKNVNPNTGTVDLVYPVVEKGASQIQLQGGYGGGGFVGTLGLSFNNFSLRGIFDKEYWKPIPMGDGQTLSLRAQASSFYQTYSISFSEPWLGGKKPVRLTTSFSHSIQYQYNFQSRDANKNHRFLITGGSIGLAKQLRIPDDYFTLSGAISFQHYDLRDYNVGLFNFPDGFSNNLAFTVGLSRDNTAVNPVFPTQGSRFSIIAKLTPPYSVFNGVNYKELISKRAIAIEEQDAEALATIDQKRFNWLEYYKLKFNGEWFNTLAGKLVLRSSVEFGFLGAYNQARGIPPFERFYMGGDGLGGYSLDGRETIQLRGYPNQSIVPANRSILSEETINDGATIYNKYTMELRYPITLKPAASIFVLGFLEGGATFDGFKEYNPFQLSRSAGVGLRLFMPAFGLLGIDFGYGFDPIPGTNGGANGWETHFIIGQQF